MPIEAPAPLSAVTKPTLISACAAVAARLSPATTASVEAIFFKIASTVCPRRETAGGKVHLVP